MKCVKIGSAEWNRLRGRSGEESWRKAIEARNQAKINSKSITGTLDLLKLH